MNSQPSGRSVVLSSEAKEAVKNIYNQFPVFKITCQGIKWLLSRKPDSGYVYGAGKIGVVTFPENTITGTPEVWVKYTFDEDSVLILDVYLP